MQWNVLTKWREHLQTLAITSSLLLALVLFGVFTHSHYPIHRWIFWHYAMYWGLCGLWSLGCISLGHVIVRQVLAKHLLPSTEHIAISFVVGVFSFYWIMSVLGLLRLFHGAVVFVLPIAMSLVGIKHWISYLRRYAPRFHRPVRIALVQSLPVLFFGIVGVGMIYFTILSPENVQFDSRWKHIALAEDYAAFGGIRRFPEGWTVATYPHLASILYTWAFLLPSPLLFDKVELAAHLEFTVFLWTLWGIVALTKRLAPHRDTRWSWVARFLFPGVFLYDSNLSLGADHIAALFSIPIYLTLWRAYDEMNPRHIVLFAVAFSGAVLTKYTSAILFFPIVLVLVVRTLVVFAKCFRKTRAQHLRQNAWLGPLVLIGSGLLLTSIHWAKNWSWYGDPVYPSLHKYLNLHPWTSEAANMFEWGYKDFQLQRPPRNWQGLLETLKALFSFSFIPNDWAKFHGKVPVFGSLFTLLILVVPFLKKTKKLWFIVVFVHMSIFVWYWTHHQDRYLQPLVPLMTAFVAAMVIRLWQYRFSVKMACAALLAYQMVWGGDVYFYQTHAMAKSPVKASLDLLFAGYKKEYDVRFKTFPTYSNLAKVLPQDARVLLHDNHVHAGIGVTSVSDWVGWQFGISYGSMKSPFEIDQMLRGMGVTHLVWDNQTSKGWDSLAGDIAFFNFVSTYAQGAKAYGSRILAKMPDEPPQQTTFEELTLVLGCKDTYAPGVYHALDLRVPVFGPKRHLFPKPQKNVDKENIDDVLPEVAFVVVDPACYSKDLGSIRKEFKLLAKRNIVNAKSKTKSKLEIWMKHAREFKDAAPAKQVEQEDELDEETME